MKTTRTTCAKCERELYLDTTSPAPSHGGHQFLWRDEDDQRTFCPAGDSHVKAA